MATAPLAALHRKLFDETDGSKFARLKDRLLNNHGIADRAAVLSILAAYIRDGQLLHWRAFLLPDMVRLTQAGEYADFYGWSLQQPKLAYWSVDGLLKSDGKAAYPTLVTLALDAGQALDVRAKAVKSLAMFSRQPFDAGRPQDPGYWKEPDLDLPALLAWQSLGYPDGTGHAEPARHRLLDAPQSPLEHALAALERKLAAQRAQEQDLAQPTNWLTIADPNDLLTIDQRWALPEHYRRFLACASPLRVEVEGEDFSQGVHLYGAHELLKAQHGYSWNPVEQAVIADWPAHYVVIADAGADPFCLDLSQANGHDAPVLHAMHGTGSWDFEPYSASLVDFIDELARAK